MVGSNFTAGRDIRGAFATGARASAVNIETAVAGSGNAILGPLSELLDALRALPGADEAAIAPLSEAVEEAGRPNPDPAKIENLVQRSLRYAREGAEFATVAEKLKPHAEEIAQWLGRVWSEWAPTIGFG